jgi:transposase
MVPTIRGRSISLISSVSVFGLLYNKVITNTTVNGEVFKEYLVELCEYLIEKKSGTVCFVIDNARIHRHSDLIYISENYGHEFMFLSPYSYMLNPIENVFSKVKSVVKSELGNNFQGTLRHLILMGLSKVSKDDCEGYFRLMCRNLTSAAAGEPYVHI